LLAYRESEAGQILHTGINEAGSMSAFTAAGIRRMRPTARPMVPIYVFYSMFGFQRTADSIWAAADQMSRGFLIGATAGRTTLTGEGTQHADGHSHLLASTNTGDPSPTIPAYGYEIAHIMQARSWRRCTARPATATPRTSSTTSPSTTSRWCSRPSRRVDAEGIVRGMYRLSEAGTSTAWARRNPSVQLLASGVGMPWALEAQQLLRDDWDRQRRRVVGDVVERAAPGGAGGRQRRFAAP
jgi:pyruvate dehydrogenase E1 component